MDNQTIEAIERLSARVDELAGSIAGISAFIAHLPHAADVDVSSAKSVAQQSAPQAISHRGTAPVQHAIHVVDRIASIAQSLEAVRSAGK